MKAPFTFYLKSIITSDERNDNVYSCQIIFKLAQNKRILRKRIDNSFSCFIIVEKEVSP